jgi:methionyl aminopeptidase
MRNAMLKRRTKIELRTPGEIDAMEATGSVVAAVLAACAEACVAGATPQDLDAIADQVMTDRGAVTVYRGYHPAWAPTPYPAVLCVSVNDVIVHAIPDDQELQPGDLVSIDFACSLDGWCADAAVTVPVGEASAQDAALMTATRACLDAGIAAAQPGGTLGDVGAALSRPARATGFGMLDDHGGHGIGRTMHAPPHVPNVGIPGQGLDLRPGLVIALEPMLLAGGRGDYRHLPDGWGVATADGSRAAHFEHTVAITADGPRVLTVRAG